MLDNEMAIFLTLLSKTKNCIKTVSKSFKGIVLLKRWERYTMSCRL
jgi:hypothetical protein